MKPEKTAELQRRLPWLPPDYLRALQGLAPGQRRYGIEWFEEPRQAVEVAGVAAGQAWPTAWWIGQRGGNLVGYELTHTRTPSLCEWGGSQQRRIARYSGIDALALSQIKPDSDRRARVEIDLDIPGLAFGVWRTGGDSVDAPCMFSVEFADTGIGAILAGLGPGWELLLMEEDRDAALCVRRERTGYELRRMGHGRAGTWEPISLEAALVACASLTHCNGGTDIWSFGRLSLPSTALAANAGMP